MTELSMVWEDAGGGDGGPYSSDEMRIFFDALGSGEGANVGVIGGALNSLEPSSPGLDQIAAASGRAFVDGTLYNNSASVTKAESRPAVGTTGKQLVLRKLWSAQTVRLYVISSADGTASIPALTQTDLTEWQVPICSFTHATDGTIAAIIDLREFTRPLFINLPVDGGGSVIGTGVVYDAIEIPKCVITGWGMLGDVSGDAVVDIAYLAGFNVPAFPGDSIAGTEKPTLSTAQTAEDTNLLTWTRNLAAGHIAMKVDSASTIIRLMCVLRGYRP